MHVIAGKAVGFGENLKPEWKEYAKQVKSNAKVLAEVLMERNFKVVSDGTDNHLILLSLLDKNIAEKMQIWHWEMLESLRIKTLFRVKCVAHL